MSDQHGLPPRSLNQSALVRFLLLVASGWAVVQLISYFYTVLALFIGAAILAVLLDYPVRRITSIGCPRPLAIAITILTGIGVMAGFVAVLGFQVVNQGTSLLNDVVTHLQSPDLPFHSYFQSLNLSSLVAVLRSSLGTGLGLVGGAFSNFFTTIFLVVIVIYMLVDNGRTWRQLLLLLPADLRERFDRTVQRNFLGFLRGQITLMLFLTVASLIVFGLLGVKFSLILAILVGVLDAIPGIGATLGVVLATTIVFLTQGQWMALKVVIASVLLQQLQDNLIHPRVMGKALEINPVVLFFALFIGERVAGLLGVFLAIPVAGVILSWRREDRDALERVAPDPKPPERGRLLEEG